MIFPARPLPRIFIFLLDSAIVVFAMILSYQLRFNFQMPKQEVELFRQIILPAIFVRLLFFALFRPYTSIIRYSSTKDATRILMSLVTGTLVFIAANIFNKNILQDKNLIPYSIIIIEFLASSFILLGYRVMIKVIFLELSIPNKTKTNVIIFGAGESGLIAKRALDRDAGTKYKVLAFIDEDSRKKGKQLEGVPIYSIDKLDELLNSNTIAHLIISIPTLDPIKKTEIAEKCLPFRTKVLVVPPVGKWINGELSFKQIKKINIEDLLDRDVIVIDNHKIGQEINDRVILVTGAAGSIGSEIVRQLCTFSPKKIICVDIAESPLYFLQVEITAMNNRQIDVSYLLSDIRNKEKTEKIFEQFKPEIVFHAAAYKHVPVLEYQPKEAILTNVMGTKNLADMAQQYGVEKFVMISTDKAVNPSNVMGASKRIAELYVRAINSPEKKTAFITTRFGNVLGSNGSVIELFKKQIAEGGPLTVTDPEVTRFFMTIPEACQLVLEAGIMGKGGEIFLFDMGQSVKIFDVAKKMVQLSGLTLGKDINIVFSGLRPGEKLYEELLTNDSNSLPTYHKKIMISREEPKIADEVIRPIIQLIEKANSGSEDKELVKSMKTIVPEFQSKNSIYSAFDK